MKKEKKTKQEQTTLRAKIKEKIKLQRTFAQIYRPTTRFELVSQVGRELCFGIANLVLATCLPMMVAAIVAGVDGFGADFSGVMRVIGSAISILMWAATAVYLLFWFPLGLFPANTWLLLYYGVVTVVFIMMSGTVCYTSIAQPLSLPWLFKRYNVPMTYCWPVLIAGFVILTLVNGYARYRTRKRQLAQKNVE